jgi:hypothetical protein
VDQGSSNPRERRAGLQQQPAAAAAACSSSSRAPRKDEKGEAHQQSVATKYLLLILLTQSLRRNPNKQSKIFPINFSVFYGGQQMNIFLLQDSSKKQLPNYCVNNINIHAKKTTFRI